MAAHQSPKLRAGVRLPDEMPVLGYIQQTLSNDRLLVRLQYFASCEISQIGKGIRKECILLCVISSVVERFSDIEEVESSILSSRTNIQWMYSKVVMQYLHTVPIASSNLATSTKQFILGRPNGEVLS
jgi:hypothetical protein